MVVLVVVIVAIVVTIVMATVIGGSCVRGSISGTDNTKWGCPKIKKYYNQNP